MPFKSEAQRRLFHAKAAKGEISDETVSEWEHASKNKKKLPMHVAKESSDDGYSQGAMVALAMFSEKAAATINPAPVLGSAATQAATQLNPLASRVATSLVSGGAGAVLNAMMAPRGDRLRQGGIGFASDAIGGALGPWGMLASPIINMGLQHVTAPNEEKQADHADDRLKERIKAEFPPDALAKLRAQAKKLELSPGRYYLPMKDKAGNTAAIAAFKTVGPKDQLVLATVLAPKKNPPSGTSLSHLMKQPMGAQVAKVDASAKQYTIRKNPEGRYTCTCKNFKFVHRAAGTHCKHIDAHLGSTKESANKLEQFLLNQGAVSQPQKTLLHKQFGRLTPKPTATSKAVTSQALALAPGAMKDTSLRSMRSLMQTPHYPEMGALNRTREISRKTLLPKLRQMGGQSHDAEYWKDKDPTYFYDEKKRWATPGEYRAKSLRLGEESAPTGLRAEHILRAGTNKTPIYTKLSPEEGQLVMYPKAPTVQREQRQRINKQRVTPGNVKPWDATDMRQTLEHEVAERKMVLDGTRKGKANAAYSSHWGSDADVAANQVAAKDPRSQWLPNNPESFIEKDHWNRLYKQHGGTRGSPIPNDSRQSRSLNDSIAKVMARAPINDQTRPDLNAALDAGIAGMPVHPELEKRLMRDYHLLRPGESVAPAMDPATKSQAALGVLQKRTRMKTSAEDDSSEEGPEESNLIRNSLMAAGLAAPFAGMIGQQEAIHAGKGKHVSVETLRQLARPGDILLSGDTQLTPVKALLSAASGTPKGYHAATVLGKNKVMGSHPAYGYEPDKMLADEHLQLLRPNLSPEEIGLHTTGVKNLEGSVGSYEKQIAKNLRSRHGFDSPDAAELASGARKGFYNNPEGIWAGVKDLFMPKLRSDDAIEADRQKIMTARDKFKKNHAGSARGAARLINAANAKTPEGANVSYDYMAKHLPECVGGVCSTVPASYMPAGKPVVPGKLPSEVLPSDYLRSKQYTPIAQVNPLGAGKSTLSDKILSAGPWAIRGGVGLGLAGGIYGASRLWDYYKNRDPEEPEALEEKSSAETVAEEPPEEHKDPWWKKMIVPGASLAAGLGTYALMRRPTYSENPALRAMQQKANKGGYRRIVDVSRIRDEAGKIVTPEPLELKKNFTKIWKNKGFSKSEDFLENAWDRAKSFADPQVHPETGNLNLANRLKLWMREGEGAIPVASEPGANGGRLWIPGQPKGKKLDLSGSIVSGRHGMSPYSNKQIRSLVRGGTDAEGSFATQKALTQLATRGKGFEADLLAKHTKDVLPKSFTRLSRWTKGTGLPKERYAQLAAIQKRMKKDIRREGVPEFALKPTQGLQSDAAFPRSGDNWAAQLRKYDRHMANPKNVAAFNEAAKIGPGETAYYLANEDLLEGHTLHHLLKDPKSAYAQHWMPGATDEWRVHTMHGEVPKATMLPRYFSNDPMGAAKAVTGLGGEDYRKELQQFVQNEVLGKLDKKYRMGRYGLDVMPFVDENGKRTFRVMEMNPFERSGLYGSEGGGSGLMDAANVPWMGHTDYRVSTGRHSQPVSIAAGLGVAGAAGAGTALAKYFISRPSDIDKEEEDVPHPVG